MRELLFKKWLDEEVLDLKELVLHHGIEGVLEEFECWLEEKEYIVSEK